MAPLLGRPARISREAIVAAGVEVGLPELTVRAVAERLGVTAAAIYRHVGSRQELETAVGEHLVAAFVPPDDVGQPLAEYLLDLSRQLRRFAAEHPGAGWYLTRVTADATVSIRMMNAFQQTLVDRGYTAAEAFVLATTVASISIGLGESHGEVHDSAADHEQHLARLVEAAGPGSVWAEVLPHLGDLDHDAYVDWQMAGVIRGVLEQLEDGSLAATWIGGGSLGAARAGGRRAGRGR
jgi:AcrR family transcriptional regulator